MKAGRLKISDRNVSKILYEGHPQGKYGNVLKGRNDAALISCLPSSNELARLKNQNTQRAFGGGSHYDCCLTAIFDATCSNSY